MREFLIFAGTIEGRTLAETLVVVGEKVHICVATEYVEEVLMTNPCLTVHRGRLDATQMAELMGQVNTKYVIDATHPYAVEASDNIFKACQMADKKYVRLLREEGDDAEDEAVIYVDSLTKATDVLNQTEGNILLTTGSKELAKYVDQISDITRIYARILPDGVMVDACRKMGLLGKQIICMQGPFSVELNRAMIKQLNIKYLVSKDTGVSGGLPEKLQAAKECGVKTVIIRRQKKETGYAMEDLLNKLLSNEALEEHVEGNDVLSGAEGSKVKNCHQVVTLLGIGMGTLQDMTIEARLACAQADVIIGAPRMVEALREFGKPSMYSYKAEEIAEYISNHPEQSQIVVAFSGDIGFYSGTKKLLEALQKMTVEVRLLCGISSVVYFASKLQTSWEDMKLISNHGRVQNLLAAVKSHKKVFSLAGYAESVRTICQELVENHMAHVKVFVGCQLSYPEEQIVIGNPKELLAFACEGLCVVVIENPQAADYVVTHGLPDEAFERGNAPMTKEEVRSISISKLALTQGAVVYDIGAGTGSISLECALQAVDGVVYAIEKKADALELLAKNKKNLGVANLEIVAGLAPEALDTLPAPTHAFVGGSSGNMREIIDCLLQKNPQVRIVINCIALETVAEVMDILKEKSFSHQDIAAVSVAKSKTLGSYHMMMGQNPVYVITLQEVVS